MMMIHWNQGKLKAIAIAALLSVTLSAPFSKALAQDNEGQFSLAIVVHKDSAVENLSLQELRKIFLAEQQFWPDRSRIILLVRAPKSEERDFVLNTIYQMDEQQFRKYWIAKMFRAEVPRGPKIVFSTDMTRELVVAIPGSISFVDADEATDDVRVLRIDGKLPDEDGYPLK
jgi:ABC-type phosphate transport system substrate-binding protein